MPLYFKECGDAAAPACGSIEEAEERVRRVEEDYGEKASDYQRYLQKIDRHRSAYYDRFTGEEWGNPHNYHLLINSAIGLPAAAQQIITLAGGKEKE